MTYTCFLNNLFFFETNLISSIDGACPWNVKLKVYSIEFCIRSRMYEAHRTCSSTLVIGIEIFYIRINFNRPIRL